MAQANDEAWVRQLLATAGIEINGPARHDLQVLDPRFYRQVLRQNSLGLGEAYMDGWWDAGAVDETIAHILDAGVQRRLRPGLAALRHGVLGYLSNLQNRARSRRAVAAHYELGNDLFRRMLDPLMNYSCGYWATAGNLTQAQHDKLELICRKLQLVPGQRVLDIGCGWGGFARHAAEHHGVSVIGITLSPAQAEYARDACRGLPVRIELRDYRDFRAEPLDRVVSIGMFEHVGSRNYRTFMRTAAALLKPDGLMLLHTIGAQTTRRGNDPWLDRYIFPNGELPSVAQLGSAMERLLMLEDWHSFGPDYDRTLMAWKANFEAAWPDLKARYGERFYRMWRYYLMLCAGAFRARYMHLWQLVLAPPGRRPAPYRSVR